MLEKALLRLWPFEEPPERWVAVVGVSVLSLIAVAGFTLTLYETSREWLLLSLGPRSAT